MPHDDPGQQSSFKLLTVNINGLTEPSRVLLDSYISKKTKLASQQLLKQRKTNYYLHITITEVPTRRDKAEFLFFFEM